MASGALVVDPSTFSASAFHSEVSQLGHALGEGAGSFGGQVVDKVPVGA